MTGIINLLRITGVWKLANGWWKFLCLHVLVYTVFLHNPVKPGHLARGQGVVPLVPPPCLSVPQELS